MLHRTGMRRALSRLSTLPPGLGLLALLVLAGAAKPRLADDLAALHALQAEARWPAAESLATAVLQRLAGERSPDSLGMADVLESLVESRRHRQAARSDSLLPQQAARVLGIRMRHLAAEDLRIADAHALLSDVLRLRGDRDAFSHADAAYAIRARRLASDDTLLAESLNRLGMLKTTRGEFVPAADYLGREVALRLRVQGEDHPGMVRLLTAWGFALREIGDIDRSRDALTRAIAIAERHGGSDDIERAVALDGLAALERQVGNLARAMDLWQEALRIARARGESAQVLRIGRNSNAALIELGDYASSARLMETVVRAYEKNYGPGDRRTLSARNSLAIARVGLDDSLRAMRELRAVETALTAQPGRADPLLGLCLKFQAALLQQRGDHTGAVALCRRAIARIRPDAADQWGDFVELHIALVVSEAALGDTTALDRDRRELLAIAAQRDLERSNLRQDVRRTNALALHALGREGEAWEEALAADRIARERLEANVRSLPERRSLQLSLRLSGTTDLVIDLARHGSEARRDSAWDALVRVRGLVHTELARRRLPADALGDTLLVRSHARWLDAQRRYAQLLVAGAAETAAPIDSLRAAAEDAERELARALARHGHQPPAAAGLADVRARLVPGEALVAFVETEAHTDSARVTAMIARAGSERIGWVELGRSADLAALVEDWRERLATPPGADPHRARARLEAERRAGDAVRRRIWDRLVPEIASASNVVIVPDGPLIGLSWFALPAGAHGYLVESGPTLHVLNAERELLDDPVPAGGGSLLAVGAPEFGPSPLLAAALPERFAAVDPCAGGLPPFAPLPGTAAEVQAVARTWAGPSQVLSGSEATEEAFKKNAAGHRILHLATHGLAARDTCLDSAPGTRGVGGLSLVSAEPPRHAPPTPAAAPAPVASPWLGRRVWLALAGANQAAQHVADENEGLLTAEEVLTLDLAGTEWVVLSACRSGAGETWSREGALGMRRAFHLAGARTVIASQWSVDDEATREWMESLYVARAHGAASAGAAMRDACRDVLARRRAEHRSTHPFYWAAFDATGE